jgi:ornithine carbamoyltransferase
MTPTETARVLVEALPYIRQFAGKSVVVKLGGAAIDRDSDLALAQDVLLLRSVGVRCVLVHGGGPQVDTMLRRVGKEPEFKDGLRVTDAETLEIVRMVLVGKINRDLVATINSQAGDEPVAVGVSGEDAGLLTVTPANSALGFVGNVTSVRAELIHRLLDDGLTPVISTVGANAEGQPYNVNADEAARAIAVAMNAEKIVREHARSSPHFGRTSRPDRARERRQGHDPQAKGLRGRGRSRRQFRTHHRWAGAPLAAYRAFDRSWRRNDGSQGEELVKHLLSLRDLTAADIEWILAAAERPAPRRLDGKGVALYFEKPSARTRNSMELATAQLGGHPVYLQPAELGIGTRESIADVTNTLACYHAIIAARVFDHGLLQQMAAVSAAPVVNLLSGSDHPLQALADLLTIKQLLGRLQGVKVAFIGEGNNVSRSLAEGCALVGAQFTIASPQGHGLEDMRRVRQVADPEEAVDGANIVYTDVWVSMGGEDSDERRAAFEPYQVNEALMARAADAWFLHCLPARRGEEVTAPVIDGPRSAVWRQAENRMHTARGAMIWMLEQN